jgi:hypothetical protein
VVSAFTLLTAGSRTKCEYFVRRARREDARMRILTPLLAMLLMSSVMMPADAQARTATAAERRTCEARIQPKIDEINARLRGGYSAEEGERLKAQRRRLESRKAGCRKV